jgi:exopolysaccharide production protein ExoZ
MIYNVHLLRVLAALAVVYYHITSEAGLNLPLACGTFGVDIFFVVSGFIIAYIGTRSPDKFLVRRFIRIVPFYWSASLLLFAVAWVFPNLLRQTRADVGHLLYSLFFIPHETAYSGLFPTLILGWTLNYEMYFYALFAVALLLSRRFAPLVCSGLLAVMVLAITLSGTQNESILFYSRPIVFEFIFGIAVYYAVALFDRRADDLRDVLWLKWLLLAATAAAGAFIVVQGLHAGFGLPRYLVCGVPAFMIVLGAILIERIYRLQLANKPTFVLGESSYILYLIHPYIIYGVLRLLVGRSSALSPATIGLLVSGLLVLCSAVAVMIHLMFEKPVMDRLRRMLIPVPQTARQHATAPVVLEPQGPRYDVLRPQGPPALSDLTKAH